MEASYIVNIDEQRIKKAIIYFSHVSSGALIQQICQIETIVLPVSI